ncbi:hypothetical protein [Hyphomicrobium sp. DY-1]|uniref:hypothetical protein n=1 Tax=Hyphomicrobium sp. DY-1 TaxID=3075650 RepID=UPI0039C2E891
MPTSFAFVFAAWEWRPIRNCPGRYALHNRTPRLPISELIGEMPTTVHRTDAARDLVIVARIDGGGVISYLRNDGTVLHTLNTPDGFTRKLRQLGVPP